MYKISKQYIHKKYRRDLITKESDFTLYKKLNSNIDLSDDLKKFILQNLEKIELNFSTCTANLTLRLIDKPSEKHAELNTEDPAKSDFPDRIKKVTKELFHSISQKYVFTNSLDFENKDYQLDLNRRFCDEYFDCLSDLPLIFDDKERLNILNCWLVNITKIMEKDYFIEVGRKSGRVYYNLTSLPSELRQAMCPIEGENIVEIDIRNCQPGLFTKFLKQNFDLVNDNDAEYADVHTFMNLTRDGQLYDYLMEKWAITDRNSFKKTFFKSVFYCRRQSNFTNPLSILFQQEFPNVWDLVVKMKETNYKNLSIQLQKLESDIVVYGVLHQIMKEKPDLWVLPIHDSLVCLESSRKYVENKLRKELKKYNLDLTTKWRIVNNID